MSKEPTPIRKRASADPQPITFPPPATFDERIRRNIYRILYHVLRSKERANIDKLTYDEFVAFCERAIVEGGGEL